MSELKPEYNPCKIMYCISCEDEFEVEKSPFGLVHAAHLPDGDIDWCEGPFASCPPPKIDDEYWEAVFASEEL